MTNKKQNDNIELINEYLNNKVKLYQDWWESLSEDEQEKLLRELEQNEHVQIK